jgi:hypothetical protein
MLALGRRFSNKLQGDGQTIHNNPSFTRLQQWYAGYSNSKRTDNAMNNNRKKGV